ncbi:acyl dehydratase [Pseudomaricurvus alkylphenolicus]|uniref:acyl dehydratase n=1 Tax=Pseudomaricurvus alkylphenolicus TaxID=1306991 RepID=UPI00141F4126|nr:acyl dehydratase [Pseudomaricurvus alkylphenolicus]NIB38058.1 acyl dehydratase [Pseudomaricurvus alkylphenolicus]
MKDLLHQVYFEDVEVGTEVPPVSITLTLQRLVMEAGANRDLSLMHHDREAAIATGSPDAFANTFFIMGMIERTLREWMGSKGTLRKITSLRMTTFNCPGDVLSFGAKVIALEPDNIVRLEVWAESKKGKTVTAEASLRLPSTV